MVSVGKGKGEQRTYGSVGEYRDGTSKKYTNRDSYAQNKDGTYKTMMNDDPKISMGDSLFGLSKKSYTFSGDWRIPLRYGKEIWETKFRLAFSFDNDGNEHSHSFEIVSPPMKIVPSSRK